VDNGNGATAVALRVGISPGDATMGCPASMTNGCIPRKGLQPVPAIDFIEFAEPFLTSTFLPHTLAS